ncbi:TrbI/VirB10 family protein [Crocosphaera chwakensis]|uniref:Uncharacterized protein n=1 Tax=Crocosphaera chwakensis CCY0110 TaxID=391612 RepID=A3IZA5_9CHRO|nr:TrbI/VirB10 family protein [Crocosphaera chwakensis]EAZ88196.1 hypothetical protein CY0110_14685 [Crocosphaera chwakensis CCY0110]
MKVETLTIDDDFFAPEPDSSTSNQEASNQGANNNLSQLTESNEALDNEDNEADEISLVSRLSSSNNNELDDELLEPNYEDEPLELEVDPNNQPGNNVLLRILLVILGTGVVALIIALVLMLFNGSNNSFNANQSESTETEEPLDPLALAQLESEKKTAQLILLGDEPVEPSVSSVVQNEQPQTTSQPAQPTQPIQPTPSPNSSPPPSTVRQVSRPPTPTQPPNASSSPSRVRQVSRPPTPTSPPNNATTPNSQPKQLPSRETLAKRGWSGFAPSEQQQDQQELANSNPVIANSNVSNSPNLLNQPPSKIPVIRISLNNKSQTIPNPSNWSYYAQKKEPFLVSLNPETNNSEQPIKLLSGNSPQNSLPTYKNQKTVSSTSTSTSPSPSPTPSSLTSQLTSHRSPTIFPVGTQLKARLETPIIWTNEMKDNPRPFTLTLTQPLVDQSGKIVLPLGTSFSGKVTNVTTNGMVIAEIITFSYQTQQQWQTIEIPSSTLLVLGNNTQPLMANVLNDPGGNIATQDAFLGALGAAQAGFNRVNTPDTQTQINTNSFGFNSTTTTNQQGNLMTGLAEGLFSTLKGRLEQRAEKATNEYANQQPIYVVNNGTEVTILVNAILEIN